MWENDYHSNRRQNEVVAYLNARNIFEMLIVL